MRKVYIATNIHIVVSSSLLGWCASPSSPWLATDCIIEAITSNLIAFSIVSFCPKAPVPSRTADFSSTSIDIPQITFKSLILAADKGLVPRSAAIIVPGQCKALQSSRENLHLRWLARILKWRVLHAPLSSVMSWMAAWLSIISDLG